MSIARSRDMYFFGWGESASSPNSTPDRVANLNGKEAVKKAAKQKIALDKRNQ